MSAQIGMAIAPEGSFLQKLGPFPTICLDLRDTNIFILWNRRLFCKNHDPKRGQYLPKKLKKKTRANICVYVSYITYTYACNRIFKFKQKDFFQTWEEIVPKWFPQESFMIKHEMNGTINRFIFWFFFVDLSWRWGSSLVQIVWKLGWEPFKGESSSENLTRFHENCQHIYFEIWIVIFKCVEKGRQVSLFIMVLNQNYVVKTFNTFKDWVWDHNFVMSDCNFAFLVLKKWSLGESSDRDSSFTYNQVCKNCRLDP